MSQKSVGVTVEEHTLFNSLVGEGTSFKGDVTVNGIFRIDGDFVGSIKTKGKVFIGRTGRAECTIQASSIVIGGIVSGSIISTEKVVILSSAVVMGQIQAPRLIAEEGVLLQGELHITGVAKEPSQFPSRRNGSIFHRWIRGREEPVHTSSIQ
ncbi:MAG: polymer-forming cytoskeletal protein [Spirochaetes bacterium]|nr:polymer-forming cytoskeletal protein [Spirochaetota bacterium]